MPRKKRTGGAIDTGPIVKSLKDDFERSRASDLQSESSKAVIASYSDVAESFDLEKALAMLPLVKDQLSKITISLCPSGGMECEQILAQDRDALFLKGILSQLEQLELANLPPTVAPEEVNVGLAESLPTPEPIAVPVPEADANTEANPDLLTSAEITDLIAEIDAVIASEPEGCGPTSTSGGSRVTISGGAAGSVFDPVLERLRRVISGSKKVTQAEAETIRERIKRIKNHRAGGKAPTAPEGNIAKALAAIQIIIDQIRSTDTIIAIALLSALTLIFTAAILSVSFTWSIQIARANNILIKNPINAQATDYTIARSASGNIFQSQYPYVLFLWFPPIILSCAALALWRMWRTGARIPGFMTAIMCIAILYGVVTMIFNYMAYFYGSRMMKLVSQRIGDFNGSAHARLYTDINILKMYTKAQSNSFLVMDAIKSAARRVPEKTSWDALAKFLYTTNMYLHFQKIGMRNPFIVQALETFNATNIIRKKSYSPSDYLFRNSTYIEDYSETIVSMMRRLQDNPLEKRKNKISEETFTNAVIQTSEWIADSNNRANTFYSEDALFPFIKMAIVMSISNTFPFIVFSWIFKDPQNRKDLLDFLSKMGAK
jgi:hypothetical protein